MSIFLLKASMTRFSLFWSFVTLEASTTGLGSLHVGAAD